MCRQRQFSENTDPILMLELSRNENWVCATVLAGFLLWQVEGDRMQRLVLPNGVRNISKKFNTSSNIILSRGDKDSFHSIERYRPDLILLILNYRQAQQVPGNRAADRLPSLQ